MAEEDESKPVRKGTLVLGESDDEGTVTGAILLAPGSEDPALKDLPVLPGYKPIAVLGSGAQGVLVRALHQELDRDVAIKFLRQEFVGHGAIRQRFFEEARLTAKLIHPNVVRVLTVDERRRAIVYEFIEGRTLMGILEHECPMDPAKAVGYCIQAAAGLGEAHSQGILHRDIKPENMIVAADGTLKILDFGLARSLEGAARTQVGMILGTPGFMAPEQARGETVGPQADIHALGSSLFLLLTGGLPYSGDDAGSLIASVLREAPRDVRSLQPDLPAALAGIVARCLAREPAERYPSMGELEEALRSCRLRRRASSAATPSATLAGQRVSGVRPVAGTAVGASPVAGVARGGRTALGERVGSGIRPGAAPRPATRMNGTPTAAFTSPDPSRRVKTTAGIAGGILIAGIAVVAGWKLTATEPPQLAVVASVTSSAEPLEPAASSEPPSPTAPAALPPEPEKPVEVVPASAVTQASVLAELNRRLLAGWLGEGGQIRFASSDDWGRTWDQWPRDPRLKAEDWQRLRLVAQGERFHLGWIGRSGGDSPTYRLASSVVGERRFGEPVDIGPAASLGSSPGLAGGRLSDGKDYLLAAWSAGRFETGGKPAGGTRKRLGDSLAVRWIAADGQPVSPLTELARRDGNPPDHVPTPAVSELGGAVIAQVKVRRAGEKAFLVASHSPGPGQDWSAPEELALPTRGHGRAFPSLAVAGGRYYLQWVENQEVNAFVPTRPILIGQSDPRTLNVARARPIRSEPAGSNSVDNELAVRGSRIWSVWLEENERALRWSTSENGGASWQEDKLLVVFKGHWKNASLAVTELGQCWVAWCGSEGGLQVMRLP